MVINKEYPAPTPSRRSIITSLVFGVFIAFFLIFFEPFEINISSGKNTLVSLLFFGAITTFVLVIFLNVLPFFFPQTFADKHWRVKHQILFSTAILLVIATFNGLYTNHINSLSFSWSNYWWIINRTFVLGSIPFSFLILIDYKRRDVQNKKEALSLQEAKKHQTETFSTYSIITDLKDETFTFEDHDFTHAEAVGNYIDLFFLKEGESTRTTYRLSLTSFEKQLNASHLQRCHRSYLVNLDKVTNVTGNAQGLKLKLAEGHQQIPVSRKYISQVRNHI